MNESDFVPCPRCKSAFEGTKKLLRQKTVLIGKLEAPVSRENVEGLEREGNMMENEDIGSGRAAPPARKRGCTATSGQGAQTAQLTERQVDTFYWQKLCALRAPARLCWSTAELQECAIRTLGPNVVPEMLTMVLDEELPAYRRAAAAFLLDLIAPGWRRAIGGITISLVRTVPGTPRSRGKATGVGGRVGHSTPRHSARCTARRVS